MRILGSVGLAALLAPYGLSYAGHLPVAHPCVARRDSAAYAGLLPADEGSAIITVNKNSRPRH